LQTCLSFAVALQSVFFVGGFAASPWLFKQLKAEFNHLGLTLSRPDGHTNKAVADGAVSYYLDHFVQSRIAKSAYGSRCLATYTECDHEHRKRLHRVFESCSGVKRLPDAFSCIIKKESRVSTTEEFSCPLVHESTFPPNTITCDITRYNGRNKTPRWTDTEPLMFTTLCHVKADVSRVPKLPCHNPSGQLYFQQRFDIILLFGLTEFKAQLSWLEGGQKKRSPAKIVYDDDAYVCKLN